MKITLGLAALCLLSGPVLAQESISHTERFNQIIAQAQAVNDSAGDKEAMVLPLASKDAENSTVASREAIVLPLVKPLPTATVPSKKQDLEALSVGTNQVEQREKELIVEKEKAAEERKKKEYLLEQIEQAKQTLAENSAKQREFINNEIEIALSKQGQNLDSVIRILKDRVFTYSVSVYSVADAKNPAKFLTKGTVVTTLNQIGVFAQYDKPAPGVVNSKDVKKDQLGPNLYISVYPQLTESARLRSDMSISGSLWDAPSPTRSKFIETSVSHESSFVSKVTDLMTETGDVHRIISDKYEIVISTVLD
ncbi:hypothetical protein RYA05_00420 [Pseudomonas syringae pv. actinidiae]|nr:hypothetical protein [Pseudomonas syringae pv. actinidiae]